MGGGISRGVGFVQRMGGSMRTGAKIPSLIDLALAIILSLYTALDLMWVALIISLKKVTAHIQNKSRRLTKSGKVPQTTESTF